jgi:PAS domain S-box-containing protein
MAVRAAIWAKISRETLQHKEYSAPMNGSARPESERPANAQPPPGADRIGAWFEGAPEGVMLLDARARVLACNRTLPAAEQPLGGLFGADPDATLLRALDEARAGLKPMRVEIQAPRADGTPGWYRVSVAPVVRQGQCRGLTLLASDVTDYKREIQRLRRSEEMMVDAQGVAHLGMWEWDITQPHATWSPELYRIYGLDPDTYVPSYENYLAMVHPDDRQRVMEATDAVFHHLKPYSHDERIYRANGELRYLHTWAFPVLDESGKLLRLTGVCQDITDRKLAENSVAEHAAQLARMNADLEQFARIAAHDLQEPLRAVASFVQLLEDRYRDRLDAEANETIGFVVQGVHRMKAVISDLLEYSQLRVQADPLQKVELAEAVAQVQAGLAALLADNAATLHHTPLPAISGDPRRIRQLLSHLVINALRFRSAQPPRIEISAKRNGGRVEVTVRDNGIGIAPAHLERIFVIFQRLNPDLPGTGAGLAICKKIVELHGGRIWAESQPGQGTAIHFTLPAAVPG